MPWWLGDNTLLPLALVAVINGIGPEFAGLLDSEGLLPYFDTRGKSRLCGSRSIAMAERCH